MKAPATQSGSGIAARRAVVRWSWRLFRREWRQQVLVLGLLSISVAAAVGFSAATYNTVGVPENAMFGSANHIYEVDDPDLRTLPDDLEAAADRFGPVDVIARWSRAIPGSVDSVGFRAQSPSGPFSAPMLALREGRYPAAGGEVALTDGIAEEFQRGIGDVFDLDGRSRTIVGLVENPSDLSDQFALVSPSDNALAMSVAILIGGNGSFDEVRSIRAFGDEHLPNADLTTRDDVKNAEVAAIVLAVTLIVLVLVSLVASAGFVAVAQRRLRQLGMLGAVGATEKHLRLVVVADGAAIGVVAAVIGAVVGMVAWIGVATRLERAVGYRIDPFNVQWWVVVTVMVLAIVTATAAAWWPARAVSRVPITNALSGRPPELRSVHRSAALAAALVLMGLVLLAWPDRTNTPILTAGVLITVVGVLLLSPAAIKVLGSIARPLPVAMRLALRDLARYRARSGVALAAVSISLGIPVAVVVAASAAEANAQLGNLASNQLLVWTRDPAQPEGVSPFYTQDPSDEGFSPYLPNLTAVDLEDMGRRVDQLASVFDHTTVSGLDVAVDPGVSDPDGRRAVTVARTTDIGYIDVGLLYVAPDNDLALYGIDLRNVDPGSDFFTTAPTGPDDIVTTGSDELYLSNMSTPPARLTGFSKLTPSYSSLPASFITPTALSERGWSATRVGWLVESDSPISDAQIADAREAAADAGLLVEVRRERLSLVTVRWGATAVGMLVALAVLAMTVGLIRAEAAHDVRILTATGASSTIRRALTASTAGMLALLGAVLGILGAYLAISVGYLGDGSGLRSVPIVHLAVIAVGAPLVAAVAGWVVTGREPRSLGRTPE